MRLRLLWPALLLCAAVSPAHAVIERKVEKKFPVPAAGAALSVDTFSGAINVTESDGDAIEITVTEQCEAKDDKAAAPKFADLDLALTQDKAGRVSVRADYRRKVTFTWETWPPVLLTFDIKVPRRTDADLHTRDGGITVGKLKGRLMLSNDSGKISAGETDGVVTARSRLGEIAITAATGFVDAETVSGGILVGRTPGGARLASSGGEIEAQQAGGDFTVRGDGSQVLVRFAYPIMRPANVATSGGNVVAIFDQRSAAEIAAECSPLDSVTARGLAPAGVPDGATRARFAAKLNGGGPPVLIRAAGGKVLLRGDPPPADFGALPAAERTGDAKVPAAEKK